MRLSVSSCSLQGAAERPLPCNYNVIQPVSAFHGGNTGSNSVGDAKPFQQLTVSSPPLYRRKKGTLLAINANAFEAAVFSHRSRHFEQASRGSDATRGSHNVSIRFTRITGTGA